MKESNTPGEKYFTPALAAAIKRVSDRVMDGSLLEADLYELCALAIKQALSSEMAANIVQVLPLAPQPETITTTTNAAPQADPDGKPGDTVSGEATPAPAVAASSFDKRDEARALLQRVADRLCSDIARDDDGRTDPLLADIYTFLNAVPSATREWKPGEPRVVCAAIRDKLGRIIAGARHFDKVMIEQIRRTASHQDAFRTAEQGFIDQHGNFLTREEAMLIATNQGQIIRDDEGRQFLFSENLY